MRKKTRCTTANLLTLFDFEQIIRKIGFKNLKISPEFVVVDFFEVGIFKSNGTCSGQIHSVQLPYNSEQLIESDENYKRYKISLDLATFPVENCLNDASISAHHQNISTKNEENIGATAPASAIINEDALITDAVLRSSDDDKDILGTQKCAVSSTVVIPFQVKKCIKFVKKKLRQCC